MKALFHSPWIFLALFVGAGFSSVAFQNCSGVNFSKSPVTADSSTGASGETGTSGITVPPSANPPSNGKAPGTAPAIGMFQPAVAVRDFSCISCHANIQANVITDMGAGNPWYMNQGGAQQRVGVTHYLPTSWQTIDVVHGKVIVPQASVPSVTLAVVPGANLANASMSLSSFLTMTGLSNYDTSDNWYQYFNLPVPGTWALANNVTQSVTESSFVYIGAPTSSEILSLVSNSNAPPWFQSVNPAQSTTGFMLATGINNKGYVTNAGNVECSNKDIVINGTLFLNNLNIYAEQGGCRLYVNGPVFIVGPINYLNSGSSIDATDNLQITSSSGVFMGVGVDGVDFDSQGQTSPNPLQNRLIGQEITAYNMVLRSAPSVSSYNSFANAILTEGQNISTNLLVDASATMGASKTSLSAAGQTRTAIDYRHLFLNAPIVQSRYLGTLTGVLVAETALFSLGEFYFNYDPVFQNVAILPALQSDILCVGGTSATCNPAQQ